ncbi:MAG: hypothetical protein ACOY0T_33465 [Myxococcota bacterium]
MSERFGRRELGGLAALAVGAFVTLPARAEAERAVLLVPLGAVPVLETRVVEAALRAFYAVEVQVHDRTPLPRSAYYPQRGRYRAERLLNELDRLGAGAFRVLGLASVDISTTKGNIQDWGILGLATIDGRVGVLSSFRCRRGAKGAEQIAHRLGKTAVHELGHTFGLEHCPNVGCVMEDGKGSVFTTDREYDLCEDCRAKLAGPNLLRTPRAEPPWPKPG